MALSENQLLTFKQEVELALIQGALVQVEPTLLMDLIDQLNAAEDDKIALEYRIKELEEEIDTTGECAACIDYADDLDDERNARQLVENELEAFKEHVRYIINGVKA